MAGTRLFICYRRDDSIGHAGRLFDRLAERFGAPQVFRDVDTLTPGEDFEQAIRRSIEACDVLLVLIGTRWLHASGADGHRRLADANDLVRLEIATALKCRRRIVPVLLQGAAMPRAEELPAELGALAQRHAVEIRDASFDRDVEHLVGLLQPGGARRFTRLLRRRGLLVLLAAGVAVLAAVWAYGLLPPSPEQARIRLVQMGMAYDADTLVDRAAAGDLPTVALFLRAGMAADAANRSGETALQWAVAKDQGPVVQALLDAGASGDKALPWAAGHGRHALLALLLARKPEAAALGQALHNAAGRPHTDIVKTLLDAGADVNARGGRRQDTALMQAAAAPSPANVQLLLARGADVALEGEGADTALLLALRPRGSGVDADEMAQRLQVVRALLDRGAALEHRLQSMHDWQPTPLLLAIDKQLTPITLLLIERGADVNATTGYYGNMQPDLSALMWAAYEGQLVVVSALLGKGAALNARNQSGRTALMIAAEQGRAEVVRLLVDRGADVGLTDRQGQNARMLAERSGHAEVARLLAPVTPSRPP